MATEDEPHNQLAAQDNAKLTGQETGDFATKDIGKDSTQSTENSSSDKPTEDKPINDKPTNDKPTNEKPKKPPPKKPAILQNCELCNVILTSQSIVEAHMASKKHAKKVQAAESMKAILGQKKVVVGNSSPYRCDICNISLNSQQQKDLHLTGMKHKYKVQKLGEANETSSENNTTSVANSGAKGAQLSQPTGGVTTGTDSSIAVQATDLKCTVCNITVNSAQQLTQHLSSKKHQLRENGVKRQQPLRRGGMGRGGAPGPFGARGRGRGQGPIRGHGPTRGQGPARGGPARGRGRGSGGVNSLSSNFQSAGFTSNYQGLGGQLSLKREHCDSTFGNGSNDDVSNSSYYQGKKIPRGAQSVPFNSMDSVDSNALRSGNNTFGGGVNAFGGGNTLFGSGNKPFGRGNKSPRGGSTPFGRGNTSFGGGNNAFGGGSSSFGGETNDFGGPSNSYGGGSSSFGGGSTSFSGGNSSFASGNTSFGGGNSLYGGGKAPYGRGESSFGAISVFGDFKNSQRGGFGRGNTSGGGRGFGQRGSFGNTAQEGGF